MYNIYPKQFRNARIPVEKNRCFVLMPFDKQHNLVYGEIKQSLTENDMICTRADELSGSVPIISNVLNEILKANFIIADLTGQNANVFYELGIAHSFKDAENIVLISQTIDDIPFDIRHLSTIIYKKDNLLHLTSKILNFIENGQKYYLFFESLQKEKIIHSVNDEKDEYLDVLQNALGSNLQMATDCIVGDTKNLTSEMVKDVIDASMGALYSVAAKGALEQLSGIVSVLGVILANCREVPYARDAMRHLLYENKLENYPVEVNDIVSLQCALATTLAAKNAFFNDVISWIISYFAKSKSATVDLNRYSLERFLLTSTNPGVDAAVVNAIFHENQYVREHMADIIGEKVINVGRDALVSQLLNEENIYAMSSMVTALGKLGDASVYPALRQWFEKRKTRILETQHFFILKHLYRAILNLGISDDFTASLENDYAEHINPFATF